MTILRKEIINNIIAIEGGYVNDSDDSGGETNYGITVSVARENGYTGEMEDLPIELAFDIYSRKYWDEVRGDDLVKLSEAIAAEVVDTGINMSTARAAEFLQRSLNVLNCSGDLYSDIKVDGDIGMKTISALESYLKSRSENALLTALNCLQGAFYIELAERREKDEKFVYGWLMQRIVLT
jgi:typhoid toxin secretion A